MQLANVMPTFPPWVATEQAACTACSARNEALRVVPGWGPLDAEIMFLGQTPGDEEDRVGQPFVGYVGDEFDEWLAALSLDRAKVFVTNAVKCHTIQNRVPRPIELATCKDLWLRRELETYDKVQVLIPLGRPALATIIGKQAVLPGPLDPWHVKVLFEPAARELFVIPLPHPAYLLRTKANKPEFLNTTLPKVREYLDTLVPDIYTRAKG
jgi:uracil-DNA glycosylase family 4